MLKSILQKPFSIENMVKSENVVGQMPSNKEAYKTVLAIAWPSIVESVLVCLVGAVDTMMVGTIGPEAIAAVGITNQPKFILLSFVLSLNVGVTALIARRKGADDPEGANRCLKQSIILSFLFAFFILGVGVLFARPLLVFAGAGPDIIESSVLYFNIILVGNFFNSICLTINASQRGVGKTRISLTTNLTANIVNIIFNYVLINGVWIFPRWGIAGAAVATVIGNIVAFLMAFKSIISKKGYLYIGTKVPWRFDKKILKGIANVGSSAMAEQVVLRIGFFVFVKMVAGLGTIELATHQICMNIISLSFGFGEGFGIAASSLVGQSLGARRPDKAMLYGSINQRLAVVVSTVLFFVFLFGRRFLVGLFTADPQVIATGAKIMIVVAFITHAQTSQVIISGCLRGAGDTKYVAMTSLISIAMIRPLLTWFLSYSIGWGLLGAWIAILIDQYMRLLVNFIRFKSEKWTTIEL